MQNARIRRTYGATAVLAGLLIAACGSDNTSSPTTPPGIQPEIINATDNFQFQVTAVENYSGTLTYNWNNTGDAADINQSCAVTGGTVTLTLLDDAGQEVYQHDLSQDGSFISASGAVGTWRVRVTMWNASGDLNFRVDKRTP